MECSDDQLWPPVFLEIQIWGWSASHVEINVVLEGPENSGGSLELNQSDHWVLSYQDHVPQIAQFGRLPSTENSPNFLHVRHNGDHGVLGNILRSPPLTYISPLSRLWALEADLLAEPLFFSSDVVCETSHRPRSCQTTSSQQNLPQVDPSQGGLETYQSLLGDRATVQGSGH